MGEIILVGISVYCVTGTVIALALCGARRGSHPPLPTHVDLTADENLPTARET